MTVLLAAISAFACGSKEGNVCYFLRLRQRGKGLLFLMFLAASGQKHQKEASPSTLPQVENPVYAQYQRERRKFSFILPAL
jgi:hypothetical protein